MVVDEFAMLYWPLMVTGLCYYLFELWSVSRILVDGLPIAGRQSRLLPQSVLNLLFAFNGPSIVGEAYERVGLRFLETPKLLNTPTAYIFEFKHRAFQLIRGDGNVIVLPVDMLDEFASLPESVATAQAGIEHDLLGHLNGLGIGKETKILRTIVQRKVTPNIGRLTPEIEDEARAVFKVTIPNCDNGWIEIMPYRTLARVAARLAARVLVGKPDCRDPRWIETAIAYTENLIKTVALLRLFPSWMHRPLCFLVPTHWFTLNYLRTAKSLMTPKAERLLLEHRGNTKSAEQETGLNALVWMTEIAEGKDRDAERLAHVELGLALASVHTTLTRIVSVLYDLINDLELLDELRAEISDISSNDSEWSPSAYSQLQKMDSVLRESQRVNPVSILGVRRVFFQAHTFSNGLHVLKGAYACLPTYAIDNDAALVDDPKLFDGLRSYRRRQLEGQPLKGDRFQFTSLDRQNLGFGYGKGACPGRFLAGLIIKIAIVKLLTEYEFRFLPGKGRPKNIFLHEFVFPWPWERVQMWRREGGVCPFSR